MNALELMDRLSGQVLGHKIRATIDGKIVVLARMVDQDWVYTTEGQELANAHSNAAAEEAAAPKTRKKAAPAVESYDKPAEPPAEEQTTAAE
jgi:hypothetical protein